MQYGNVSILLNSIEDELETLKYFWAVNDETVFKQNGVIRTNCIDCLDRTNVGIHARLNYISSSCHRQTFPTESYHDKSGIGAS